MDEASDLADRRFPVPIPENARPFVDVLGIDGAFDFFMKFGGAQTYFAELPSERSRIVKAIGRDKAIALARRLDVPPNVLRVPVPKPFMAKVLKLRGISNAEIARQLHVSDVSVRAMLKDHGKTARPRALDVSA